MICAGTSLLSPCSWMPRGWRSTRARWSCSPWTPRSPRREMLPLRRSPRLPSFLERLCHPSVSVSKICQIVWFFLSYIFLNSFLSTEMSIPKKRSQLIPPVKVELSKDVKTCIFSHKGVVYSLIPTPHNTSKKIFSRFIISAILFPGF